MVVMFATIEKAKEVFHEMTRISPYSCFDDRGNRMELEEFEVVLKQVVPEFKVVFINNGRFEDTRLLLRKQAEQVSRRNTHRL